MNEKSDPRKSSASANSADQSADDEMARYGITHQTVDVYFLGNYRYSTLKDALAQAKRAGKFGKVMSLTDSSVPERNLKPSMEKICKHIAVVSTNAEGMKETGFGSFEACRAVYDALSKRYQHVTFHEVTSTITLNDIVKEAPDLVILTSKYFVEKNQIRRRGFLSIFQIVESLL